MKKILLTITCMVLTIFAVNNLAEAKTETLKIGKKKFNVSMNTGDKIKLKHKKISGKLKWRSSNKSVATVSAKGIVKAKKAGKTTITAKAGKVKVTGKIKVYNKPVATDFLTPEITATPTAVPTNFPTSTVIPATSPTPTVIPATSPTPTATPKPVLCADTWLFLEIDQESITKDTEVISGKVLCKGSMEVLIQVKLNKMVIAEKVMTKDEDSFSIETDFSQKATGSDVTIRASRVGGDFEESEDDEWIYHSMVWPKSVTYKLK